MLTLNSELEESVPFLYNKVDYFYKLRTDMDFLYRSTLMDSFEFSKTCDPLLINPAAVHIKNPEHFKHKLDIPIPVEQLSQVKTAEQLLNDHCGKKESAPPTPQLSNRKVPLAQQESVESRHNTPQRADSEDIVMTQDEDTDITFVPLSVTASNLPTVLGEYFPKMDASIKVTTSGIDLLTSLEGGNWFWLKSSEGSVIGLLVYTIDTSSLRFRRINISHLSTIELSSYENALSSSIAYIWA